MRINQIKVSKSLFFFKDKMMDTYKFVDYNNTEDPCVFFGMYRDEDLISLKNHNGKKIIIWGGSDAMKSIKFSEEILKINDVTNYSISNFVYNSLKKNKIDSILKPIFTQPITKNLVPRGDSIYFYNGNGSYSSRNFYGGELVDQLKKRLPYRIIEASHNTYNKNQIKKVYENCFLGLRLTNHDGLPNTICELGLMGRNCIHNGDLPNCLKYKNLNDIISLINFEYNSRKNDNSNIVDGVYDYLNINDDWLYI